MRTCTFSMVFTAALIGLGLSSDLALRAQDLTDSLATENGDVNGDGRRDIADSIYLLNWIFSTGPAPRPILCESPVSESPLYDGFTGEEVDGVATLLRTPEGLSMKLRSAAFPPGHVMTVWWCFFNNPDACAGGPGTCGNVMSDWDNPETGADCVYGTGVIAGADGEEVTVSAFLETGGMEGSVNPVYGLEVVGLQDPMSAEVQIWVRDHLEMDPQRIKAQLTTYERECEGCADTFFTVHVP